ncbi:IclR family transcriptional regulator [Hydrogenophaga sp.]|uniref:IclR family transcriptional regulator n=1 Tax=Hydrogenophaga sp. TaxID=1904254 RepID=UPI00356B5B94
MTTTTNVLQVLQMLKQGSYRVGAADVMKQLQVSRATAYRYLRELESAGLIEGASAGEYVLGPTVIELDRLIRKNDPLIAAATDIAKTLSERTGGTVLLCRLHGHKVVCVHQVRGSKGPPKVSYERGLAMPLFRGATSRIILAHMEPARVQAIVAEHQDELLGAKLPTAPDALARRLAQVRADKVCFTRGEVDRDALGCAAAIQHSGLLGSLSVVLARSAAPSDPERLADQVLRAALRIEGRLQAAY